MDKDYYQILKLPPDAPPQQIKKAYIKLIKQVHPDKNPKDPASVERAKSINAAYAVLKDEQKRRRYDRTRERRGKPDGARPDEDDAGTRPVYSHLHTMMLFKKNPQALKSVALHAFNGGRFSFAGSLLERGIKLTPGDHELHLGLSWCLFHQGHYERCARVLEKLLALNPKIADAWINLAHLQELDGDLSGAVKTLQAAQKHFPKLSQLKSGIVAIQQKMESEVHS